MTFPLISLLSFLAIFCLLAQSQHLTLIGHRGGFLGLIPEHTAASHSLGAEQGAEYLEPDVVSTKDGILILSHDLDLSATTNVASIPEFQGKRSTRILLDGSNKPVNVSGFFVDDFTLVEIKSLRTVSRVTKGTGPFDNVYEILTFNEMLDLVKSSSSLFKREIGVYPEAKSAGYFRAVGLPLEEKMLDALFEKGFVDYAETGHFYNSKTKSDGKPLVYLQSFEKESLIAFKGLTNVPLIQLIEDEQTVKEALESGQTGFPNLSPEGLKDISTYAQGIGMYYADVYSKNLNAVDSAHKLKLLVHVYTLREDIKIYNDMLMHKVDGVFSNNVDVGRIFNGSQVACNGPIDWKPAVTVGILFGSILVAWITYFVVRNRREKKKEAAIQLDRRNLMIDDD